MPFNIQTTRAESRTRLTRHLPLMLHALPPRFAPTFWAVLLVLTLQTSFAAADARVDVEVKDASGRLASGQVTLSAGTVSKRCTTVGGRCSITIAAGTYQARLIPSSGTTVTKQVSVPASGSIRLLLQIPAPTAAPTPTTGTTKPPTTTQSQGTTPTNLRNLAAGQRLLVQGSVLDPSGRLANASVTLEQNGRAIGTTTCVGGRFAMYDLAAGTYRVVATGANGVRATANLTVTTALLRPTLRLAAP